MMFSGRSMYCKVVRSYLLLYALWQQRWNASKNSVNLLLAAGITFNKTIKKQMFFAGEYMPGCCCLLVEGL
jgi:hypothetical protein